MIGPLPTLEGIGTTLGAVLVIAAFVPSRQAAESATSSAMPGLSRPVVLGLVVLALIIVGLATKSALGI